MPQALGNERDAHVVEDICAYITATPPRSFFLFAGAGSGKTRCDEWRRLENINECRKVRHNTQSSERVGIPFLCGQGRPQESGILCSSSGPEATSREDSVRSVGRSYTL